MLEVGDEGRANLDQQRLQLCVLGVRNQGLVQRIDDGLVVRHLMVDIGPVKGCALEFLQRCVVVVAAFLFRCFADNGRVCKDFF